MRDMRNKLETQKEKLAGRKRKYPAQQSEIKKELTKILAKTPSQARINSMHAQSLDELCDLRKRRIGSLDRYARVLHRFSSLLSQTEQELGQKFDLPSASQQFRSMLK